MMFATFNEFYEELIIHYDASYRTADLVAYWSRLRGVPARQFQIACDEWMDTEDRFPDVDELASRCGLTGQEVAR